MGRWRAWAARAAALSVALSLLAAVLLFPTEKGAGAHVDKPQATQAPPTRTASSLAPPTRTASSLAPPTRTASSRAPPTRTAASLAPPTRTASRRAPRTVLQLGAAGGYLFLRVPPSFFTGNFTIELWYKTAAARDGSGRRLALISNERHSADNAAYNQRHVGLYVEPSGALTAEFRAHDRREGRIDAGQLAADGQWHHYALVRDKAAQTLSVYVDGAVAGTPVHLPNGVDIEAQDQPVVLGGGNDLATHPGALDGIRFWTVPHTSASSAQEPRRPAGLLIEYSFADGASVSAGRPRFALDVAGSGIDAVLMHDAAVVPAPPASAVPSASGAVEPPEPDGLVVTSLFTQYNGRSMYGPDVNDDSNFFQLDHYVSGLFTDVTRLRLRLLVVYDMLSPAFLAQYASPYIRFVQVPVHPTRQVNDQRYFDYHAYLTAAGADVPRYVLSVDLRDTRFNHNPFAAMRLSDPTPEGLGDSGSSTGGSGGGGGGGVLWVQEVRYAIPAEIYSQCSLVAPAAWSAAVHNPYYCAGVVGGTRDAFVRLLALMLDALNSGPVTSDCNMQALNWAVRTLQGADAEVRVHVGPPFVNRQHDRVLSGRDAVYHGSWFMDRNGARQDSLEPIP